MKKREAFPLIRAGASIGSLILVWAAVSCRPAERELPGGGNYLPLNEGRWWSLRSPSSSKPITLGVVSAKAGRIRLRFDNPWISSELWLTSRDGRFYVTATVMNGQTASLPPDTLYWDTSAHEKQTWSSPLGHYQVASRHKKVHAMGRDFENCIEIEETTQQGNHLYWTFAPDTGFVQFGEGKDAFVLESTAQPASLPNVAPRHTGGIRVALDANPFANEDYDPRSVGARFRQARDAGVNFIYMSPKWNEIETDRERYKLNDVGYKIDEAREENLPAVLHIRIIDTNQRAVPADLMDQPFDSEQVGIRLDRLLDAVLPKLEGRVKYFLVGNEIDPYFKQHPGEVQAFAKLVARATVHIRNSVPDAQISVSTTLDGIEDGHLRPILDQTAFFALTYYPMSPDFVVRDPSTVDADFTRILQAAGTKRIFLQEVGYPTSPNNGSSEEKQAELFSRVLDRVAADPGRFVGVNFTFMSDFSDSLVKSFTAYYHMPGVNRFASFLKTLGMFDDRGRPKKAWDVFAHKVKSLT
jgi:hypothetical protein